MWQATQHYSVPALQCHRNAADQSALWRLLVWEQRRKGWKKKSKIPVNISRRKDEFFYPNVRPWSNSTTKKMRSKTHYASMPGSGWMRVIPRASLVAFATRHRFLTIRNRNVSLQAISIRILGIETTAHDRSKLKLKIPPLIASSTSELQHSYSAKLSLWQGDLMYREIRRLRRNILSGKLSKSFHKQLSSKSIVSLNEL